jgi:beta-galactosidase/beta-glucuronidase
LPAFGADAVVEEMAISLNGIWRIQPVGREEREIAVPSSWERLPGLRDVNEATHTRDFDVPESFAGRRVLLQSDAVNDAPEVSVNGQHTGGHVGAYLPFEVDITTLVTIPSTGTRFNIRCLINLNKPSA